MAVDKHGVDWDRLECESERMLSQWADAQLPGYALGSSDESAFEYGFELGFRIGSGEVIP